MATKKKTTRKAPKETDIAFKMKVNKSFSDVKAASEELEIRLKKLRKTLDDGTYDPMFWTE